MVSYGTIYNVGGSNQKSWGLFHGTNYPVAGFFWGKVAQFATIKKKKFHIL
jgi:hypothetical protein